VIVANMAPITATTAGVPFHEIEDVKLRALHQRLSQLASAAAVGTVKEQSPAIGNDNVVVPPPVASLETLMQVLYPYVSSDVWVMMPTTAPTAATAVAAYTEATTATTNVVGAATAGNSASTSSVSSPLSCLLSTMWPFQEQVRVLVSLFGLGSHKEEQLVEAGPETNQP
jgi:hypothetical protein